MAWMSPTGFVDPDSMYVTEAGAYDGSTTSGYLYSSEASRGHYVEYTISSISCGKIRIFGRRETKPDYDMDVDLYYDGAWHNIYSGLLSVGVWVEVTNSAGIKNVTALRLKRNSISDLIYIYEIEFDGYVGVPLITIQSPTDILPTTVTGNGNITALGGENSTVRGFKYGLTQVDTWDVHDNGSFGTGAYTKGLTGLLANTTYWIRAYATNTIGTSYSEWREFQTAAAGVIPTGTLIVICSDYSSYTYQLQRSETDDGETYTAYFVISTDLTNKQGLSYYKRILDLHLYFRSESAGTAIIEVKRDNEATWQSVGTVSLTGTEDIIVKHLAPDIRAKHFLFKISATNFFRFLGCLFEYLPEEMR